MATNTEKASQIYDLARRAAYDAGGIDNVHDLNSYMTGWLLARVKPSLIAEAAAAALAHLGVEP